MRDSKRIKKYCNQLAKMWSKVPCWRFGQFLSNTVGGILQEVGASDIFYIEDEQWFDAWGKVMDEISPNSKETE